MKITLAVLSIITLSMLIMISLTRLSMGINKNTNSKSITETATYEIDPPITRVEQLGKLQNQLQSIYPYFDGLYLSIGFLISLVLGIFCYSMRKTFKTFKKGN